MSAAAVKNLANLLRRHRGAAVLTGAGISTESDIPDFRSPGTGLYATIDPMEYLSVDAFSAHPKKFWKYFSEAFGAVTAAQPNAGHKALAGLEAGGYVGSIITQNIDGLHQKAGSRRVLEVHGHLRTARCEDCATRIPLTDALEQAAAGRLPSCPKCRGPLRPDVVLFGDMMPRVFSDAVEVVREAELLLVVGSSLSVSPANTLASQAQRLAIINREPTLYDARAETAIHAGAGETLAALVAELCQ
jgi:NAD-dependent deacetylase